MKMGCLQVKIVWGMAFVLLGGSLAWTEVSESETPGQVHIEDFEGEMQENGLPVGWLPLTFPAISKHTQYTVEEESGDTYLKAEADHAASGIYKKIEIDLKRYPILGWRWKIHHILAQGDEKTKAGDDYAARVYVIFDFNRKKASFWDRSKYELMKFLYGEYPPAGALNYIWANHLPKGQSIPNAYAREAKMIAVESGPEYAGQWREERVNVLEDYKRLFGKEPPPVAGIAVMTDADDTGGSAVGYYDDLSFYEH